MWLGQGTPVLQLASILHLSSSVMVHFSHDFALIFPIQLYPTLIFSTSGWRPSHSQPPGIGIMAALRETDLVRFDFQVSYIVEERRLKGEEELMLEEPSW